MNRVHVLITQHTLIRKGPAQKAQRYGALYSVVGGGGESDQHYEERLLSNLE